MSQNTIDGPMSGQPMLFRFGVFELDPHEELLWRSGVTVRMQPQPFKLLRLLVVEAGRLVTRDQIRAALWKNDTFVDFEQGVNFAIRQVREALDDDAERPLYIETVPKRGYRFLAPVEVVRPGEDEDEPELRTDLRLHKALWANIAELRLAEEERRKADEARRIAEEARRKRRNVVMAAVGIAAAVIAALALVVIMWR